MARKYNPHAIEQKWQSHWPAERKSYELHPGEEKYYALDMFSYPSSEGLHVGHWRPYIIADVWSRYQTMLGKKVLHPTGFDAFGLPAENAAIKTQTHPAIYTEKAIANFTRQIKQAGIMYDWSTKVITSSPDYYKWTQWLFLQLYKNGLAYRRTALVNWCPKDQTVLANEQVVNGACERCGTTVVKKQLKQWFFKITDFAEELLDFSHSQWPDRVKTAQINWIGRSVGADIRFLVDGSKTEINVFTTRPDTLMGVTYLILAPEHPLVSELTTPEQKQSVDAYVESSKKKSEIDRLAEERNKTGVFTGAYAIHPLTKERIPIWIADYVIGTYGTGAIMGVPAHDTRDFSFAKDYNLPIQYVIEPESGTLDTSIAYTDHGIMVSSQSFDGMTSNEGAKAIVAELEKQGKGKTTTHYRLRDWLVSRQRYWGAPIPIIYCEKCGEQPVPEKDLPVILPEDVEFMPTGGSPLDRHPTFKHATCPQCSGPATRETDTLDTFVDSSWYYLRYTSPQNKEKAFDYEQVKKWLPVDFYIGGVEHSILHLLYARFVMKALHRFKMAPYAEPFNIFYGNGMIYLHGSKMSKSKGNVVSPDEMIEKYGSDSLRGYILFIGPADQDVEWQTSGINGVRRFLERSWNLFGEANQSDTGQTIHPAIKKAYASLQQLLREFSFNRAISSLMIAINELADTRLNKYEAELLALLHAPFFPHFAEEIWERLGHSDSIFTARWPDITVEDEEAAVYAIQVNGKLRGTITVEKNLSESEVIKTATVYLENKQPISPESIIKTIFIPGRIVNFVVK